MVRISPARLIADPREESLHLFCKQMLKSRLFKGFYKERCYIDAVNDYRDLIIVNRNEKDLIVILEDIEKRLRQFYGSETSPMWIGVTTTQTTASAASPDTCMWVELDGLSFDQYWFSVKSVRLRDNEIIIKLKPIRPVEREPVDAFNASNESKDVPVSINLEDFIQLILNWGTSTKRTLYDFMSNDISKENLKSLFKFLILLCISLFSGLIEVIRFTGVFTIRLLMEFRKLLAVSTPIIMRLIDLCTKLVGGFYILLAMIWRDLRGGRPRAPQPQLLYQPPQRMTITYDDSPSYQRIRMSQKRVQYFN